MLAMGSSKEQTPQPPMKETSQQLVIDRNVTLINWKDALIGKQLVGDLEEVKETSGIEMMEQESTLQEELTDVQAFDQSPNKVLDIVQQQPLVMVSQEKGFKSFLERNKSQGGRSPSQGYIQTIPSMIINRKKHHLSDLPLQFNVLQPQGSSEVSFSEKFGKLSHHHQKAQSTVNFKSPISSPQFRSRRSSKVTEKITQCQPPSIVNKLRSIVQELELPKETQNERQAEMNEYKRKKFEELRSKILNRTNELAEINSKNNTMHQRDFTFKNSMDQELQVSFESAEKQKRKESSQEERHFISENARPLFESIQQVYTKRVAFGLMTILKHSIDLQKVQYLEKVHRKCTKRNVLKTLKRVSLQSKAVKNLSGFIIRKQDNQLSKLKRDVLLQWINVNSHMNQLEKDQTKLDTAQSLIEILSSLFKDNSTLGLIQGFNAIKVHFLEAKQLEIQDKQQKAASDLFLILQGSIQDQQIHALLKIQIYARERKLQSLIIQIDSKNQERIMFNKKEGFKAFIANFLKASIGIQKELLRMREAQNLRELRQRNMQLAKAVRIIERQRQAALKIYEKIAIIIFTLELP